MIDVATYTIERAICAKALATMQALWPEHAKGGAIPQAVCDHPDYKACDNAMRGRVEQYELRTNPPERFVAYIGRGKRNGLGVDRIIGQSYSLTTWNGDELGDATFGSSWSVNSYVGSRMYQIYAWMGGREYTGRGLGEGMSVVLRETAASKRKRGSTPTGKGKAAMRKPQRLVVTPIVRPETQAAFILAQVAKSDIWYAEKFGPEHCTQCFSRAVSLGIVFG